MTKRKIAVSPNQQSFFSMLAEIIPNEARRDERPLPLIVAEKWQFPLTHIQADDSSDNLYCARDWYIGLGGFKSRWSSSKDDWFTTDNQSEEKIHVTLIETKRERRAPEMLEYLTEKGLYDLTQIMRVTKGNADRLKPIKDYLSISGIRLDEARRDERRGMTLAKAIVSQHRQDGIIQRKKFTAVARDTHVTGKPRYDILTNTIYHKIGKTATEKYAARELADALFLSDKEAKHMRDFFNPLLTKSIEMAEEASNLAFLNYGRKLSTDEQIAITKQCARVVAVTAWQLADVAKVDLVTAKPLLQRGKDKQ